MMESFDIQRLTKPFLRNGEPMPNPFSFGGGLRDGGLSEDAMKLLAPIFDFDYMGAAEFEFGALPKALDRMVKSESGSLAAFSVDVKTGKTKTYPFKEEKDGVCADTVYVVCPEAWCAEVKDRIQKFARAERTLRTRESVGLERSIREKAAGNEPRYLGWIEINNGYMFFLDKDMWLKVLELFGVKAPSE